MMRAPRQPPPAAVSWRVHAADLGATLALVWESSRWRTVLIATMSLLQAGIPAVNMWIAKLLLDGVAAAMAGARLRPVALRPPPSGDDAYRFDPEDDLHVRNHEWLTRRDGLTVVTDPDDLVAPIVGWPS